MEPFIRIKMNLALKSYNGWYAIKPNQTKPNPIYLICMYKEALALNNNGWSAIKSTKTKSYI